MRVRVEGSPEEFADKAVDLLSTVAAKVSFHPLAKAIIAKAAEAKQPTGLDRERTTVGRHLLERVLQRYDVMFTGLAGDVAASLVRQGLAKADVPDLEFAPAVPDAQHLATEISSIIQQHHNRLADELTGAGNDADSDYSPITMAYMFGLLLGNAKDRAAVEQMPPEKFVEAAGPIALPVDEQRKAEALAVDAAQRVRHFGSELATAATAAITAGVLAGSSDAISKRVMGVLKRGRGRWGRVAATVLHAARDRGSVRRHAQASSAAEQTAYVYRQAQADACIYCIALNTGPDGMPRIFRLEDLEAAGTNAGRTKAEWQAVLGPIHPFCRCATHPVPEGHGFDEHGALVAGGTFGARYESEEEVLRALAQENLDLKKSCCDAAHVVPQPSAAVKPAPPVGPALMLSKGATSQDNKGGPNVFGVPGTSVVNTPVSPSGAAGPNLAGGVPLPKQHLVDETTARDWIHGNQRTDRELAFDRRALDARKRGIYEAFEMKQLDDGTHAARGIDVPPDVDVEGMYADVEHNKEAIAAEAARRDPGDDVINKPVRLTLHAGGLPDAVNDPNAPRPGDPLPLGKSVTVNKRRFGEVQLTRTADGFRVKMPDETHTAFPSLSAACDHVWAVAKGFQDADDYKAQMKAKKVPSGAGWRFWGLKPRRATKGAVA